MTSNHLKLNAKKTQFIWLGLLYYTASVSRLPLSVNRFIVFPDDTVWNFGMTFDTQLTLRHHINSVVRIFQLYQLRSVRRSLTMKHCTPLSKRSSQVPLITATLSCTVSPTASSDDCIQPCMLPADHRHPTLRAHHTDTA